MNHGLRFRLRAQRGVGMTEYPKRGEIYLVRLPSKPKDIKDRPGLIVSLDIRNKLANDVIIVPLSTNLRTAPIHVLLQKGEGGLSRDSMAKCEQLGCIDKGFLVRGPFASKVSGDKMKKIEKAMMIAIGIL